MRPQQKAQANGQTVAGPQEDIKVIEEKKKPPPAPAPAPAQIPADTKVGPPSIHTGFVEDVCVFVDIFVVTKAFLAQLWCISLAFLRSKTV